MKVRLGTRGSRLALLQADLAAAALRAAGAEVDIAPIRTSGDRLAQVALADFGGKALFVKEIEEALVAREVDVGVHSLKDLPGELPRGLCLAAVVERDDPADVLLTRRAGGLGGLPAGAVVGTSSLRRQALLRAERPDLRFLPLRGNVDTRLRKLEEGVCDGLVMARAGLNRLGLSPANAEALAPASFVPAVGQGIIGLEARAEDAELLELLRRVDHTETHMQALAERAFLVALGADCHTPVAGWARTERDSLVLTGLVASIDGARVLRGVGRGPVTEAEAVGRRLGEELLARGADDLLRAAGGAPRPGANSSV